MEDIQDGKTTVLQNTGFEPNTLVLGYQVWAELINHPDFVDRIKHTSTDRVNQDLIAGLFGIERLLISKAIKATNVEGETAAYSFVHGKSAWLGYVAPDVGLEVPTAGATFVWRGATDGQAAMGADIATVQFEIPEKRVRRVEAQMAWDSKVIGSDLGYYLASVVA
jgi:hypothetical protein